MGKHDGRSCVLITGATAELDMNYQNYMLMRDIT